MVKGYKLDWRFDATGSRAANMNNADVTFGPHKLRLYGMSEPQRKDLLALLMALHSELEALYASRNG